MNCEQARKKILLRESGEISGAEQGRLARHLSECRECADYAAFATRVTAEVRSAWAAAEPSPAVSERIRAAARDRVGRRILFPAPSLRLAAVAALLVAALGIGFLLGRGRETRRDRTAAVSAMILMLTEEDDPVQDHFEQAEKGDLDALASQLLLLEGFRTDAAANGV
jgi:anti-sigma factor RsiW